MRKAFVIRIDPELWKAIEAWSQAELRSVNGQIEYLLRQAVLKREGARARPPALTGAPAAEDGAGADLGGRRPR
jgi:hypothetical protein